MLCLVYFQNVESLLVNFENIAFRPGSEMGLCDM